MTVSANQLQEFDEATAFERYAIETSIPAHADSLNTASMDLRRPVGHIEVGAEIGVHVAIGVTENLSAGAVTSTIGRLRPLIFGAAFKVVDLMLELALEAAGKTPTSGHRWLITEKVAAARAAAGDLPPVTDTFPDGWQRLCALYAEWEEVRHSLVHRTASVDVATGALVGHDRTGKPLTPLSAEDQEQFTRLATEISRAVLAGDLELRSRKRLAWRFNQLKAHHHLPDLTDAAKPGTAVDVIANLEELPDGVWRIDAQAVFDKAKAVFQEASAFNGLFHATVGSTDRVFRCNLEDAPTTADFELDQPPTWLTEVLGAT
jgi:hypothetical protein